MGFLVGFLDALLSAFQNTQFRKLPAVHPFVINWLRSLAGLGVIGATLTLFGLWEIPSARVVWLIIAAAIFSELLFAWSFVRSFQLAPQSLVGPLFAFSAIFLVPAGILFLGETPSLWGIMGITAITAGGFALGWDVNDPGIRKALRRIFAERGSWYMLGAAAVTSVSVTLTKLGYLFTSPLVFAFWVILGMALVQTPLALTKSFVGLAEKKRYAALMLGAYGAKTALNYIGLSLLFAAYYIAVKRLAVVFDVVFGRTLGGEKEEFPRRLIASLIMFAGVALIALAG